MNWFFKIIRIAGASFPGAASLVQFQAEIDQEVLNKRIQKLEDPISTLHEDIYDVSQEIYGELKTADSISLGFDEKFYSKYSRALSVLNSCQLISQNRVLGSRTPRGIQLSDPTYILYMAAHFENQRSMQEIFDIVEGCQIGETISADQLGLSLELPKYVVRSVFEVFESKGFGIRCGGLAKLRYTGIA